MSNDVMHQTHISKLVAFTFFICILFMSGTAFSATVLHEFRFDDSLDDSLGNEGQLTAYTTQEYNHGAWAWMANTSPGCGLILDTSPTDPMNDSPGFTISYEVVGPGYYKITAYEASHEDIGV